MNTNSFWGRLAKHVRAGLVLSVMVVLAAAVASFTLSFIALREVAGNHVTGWGQYAWVFPAIIDLGLIGCEITFLTLSMMSNTGLQQLVAAGGMLAFGVFTVYFNATRVPPVWRLVTGAPPVAGIILTLMFGMLLKASAVHAGVAWIQQGAPLPMAGIGPPGGPIQGYISRPAPYGIFPSPQIGQEFGEDGASKKRLVAHYLSQVDPEDLPALTAREVAQDMTYQGVPVTAQTVTPVLRDFRAKRNGKA